MDTTVDCQIFIKYLWHTKFLYNAIMKNLQDFFFVCRKVLESNIQLNIRNISNLLGWDYFC